jgi:hypothetical protein
MGGGHLQVEDDMADFLVIYQGGDRYAVPPYWFSELFVDEPHAQRRLNH